MLLVSLISYGLLDSIKFVKPLLRKSSAMQKRKCDKGPPLEN